MTGGVTTAQIEPARVTSASYCAGTPRTATEASAPDIMNTLMIDENIITTASTPANTGNTGTLIEATAPAT